MHVTIANFQTYNFAFMFVIFSWMKQQYITNKSKISATNAIS